MLMSHQKTEQNHSIKLVNRSFEYVVKFKFLWATLTDQNCIHKEIKSTLNWECLLPSDCVVFPTTVYECQD
jgi:hypothetical protein